MQKHKLSSRLFFVALVSAVLVLICVLLINYFGRYHLTTDYLFLSGFAVFVVYYIALYYFFYVEVAHNIDLLTEKIRARFLTNEIPLKRSQLEEQDSISLLEERVDLLVETREREVRQFENLDSYRKEYLGNVSHELKTPVFNIQGYIDTLINGGLEDPSINLNYLKKAEKSIDRLINIIDDLETITQLESGVLELDIDVWDIAQMTKDIYSSLELLAARKNIKLELARKYDKPVLVSADKFRIRQVMVNLITNSIKYGKENGATLVTFNYQDDDVIIEIKDNGVGIDAKHLPRVFERFYRVDKGRSREQGGTGLGLAIVKHIIEAHEKSIRVESEAGKGTAFTFSLKNGG